MKGMSHFVRMPPLTLLALAVVCGCHFPGASGGGTAQYHQLFHRRVTHSFLCRVGEILLEAAQSCKK